MRRTAQRIRPERRDRLRGPLGLVLLAIAATGSAAQPPSGTQPAGAVTRPNPHWSPAGCPSCHGPASPAKGGRLTYQPIPRDRINALCWRCHDGTGAPREVHPVGRFFTGDQVVMPGNWPTQDGKLACITCHDIRSACDWVGRKPTANTAFLRDDGSEDLLRFCAKCHVAAVMARARQYSPHIMLDAEGRPDCQVCLFCHQQRLNCERRERRTGQPLLRADGITLCVGCHGAHIDYFEPGHIGRIAPAWIIRNMQKADKRARSQPTNDDRGSQGARLPQRLPLGPGYRIECATCHNPHQAGLFPAGSPLGWGAMEHRDHERPKLRGFGKEICWACHDR